MSGQATGSRRMARNTVGSDPFCPTRLTPAANRRAVSQVPIGLLNAMSIFMRRTCYTIQFRDFE